jgi:hypothetical protein
MKKLISAVLLFVAFGPVVFPIHFEASAQPDICPNRHQECVTVPIYGYVNGVYTVVRYETRFAVGCAAKDSAVPSPPHTEGQVKWRQVLWTNCGLNWLTVDMDLNLEEMTPNERNRIEYLRRVAQILRMPPDELIKECDEIMALKERREVINQQREILRSQSYIHAALIGPPNDAVTYIPLALRK